MQIVISLIPLALMGMLYALYVKLSAKILRGTSISWKHTFIFSLIIVALTLTSQMGFALSGITLPIFLSIPLALFVHLSLGGWFFSTRGTTKQGQLIGWRGGMQVIAIAFVFLGLSAALLLGVINLASVPTQP